MKIIMLTGLLCIPVIMQAGSLGKYQVEDSRSQSIRGVEPRESINVDPRLMQKLERSREARRKEQLFYSNFEQSVQGLNEQQRAQWLAEYRQKLKTASARETINKQEVTHYTRLIAIIQQNMR